MIRSPWPILVLATFVFQTAVGQEDGSVADAPDVRNDESAAVAEAPTSEAPPETLDEPEEPVGQSREQPREESVAESLVEPVPENQSVDTPSAESTTSESLSAGSDQTTDGDPDDLPDEPVVDISEMSAADMLSEFQVLYTSERIPEALEIAEQLVTYQTRRLPPFDPQLIQPLLNLAEVRVASNQPTAALRAYDQAIEIIERDGGVYDERLIDALVQSGRILSAGGQYDDATNIFLRAQHVIHRDDGVYSVDQLETLDYMTENYLAVQDYVGADKVQNFAYAISYRVYKDQPRRVVDAMIKLAEFQQRIGMYDQARRQYLSAIQYTEDELDSSNMQMVTLMKGLGSIGMHEQMTGVPHARAIGASGPAMGPSPDLYMGRKEATLALEQTVELMEQFPQDITAVERAYAYLDLGDWYLLIAKSQESLLAYQQAWTIMAAEPNSEDLLEEAFAQPKRIRYRKPPLPSNGVPGAYENYDGTYVEVRFDVEADGSVSNVSVVDSNTPNALSNDMRRAVSTSLFRPRFVDGQPASATGMRVRENFAGNSWQSAD